MNGSAQVESKLCWSSYIKSCIVLQLVYTHTSLSLPSLKVLSDDAWSDNQDLEAKMSG